MPAAANPAACADACPAGVLAIGRKSTGIQLYRTGASGKCVLCNICGVVCPDVAVGVVEE